VDHLALGDAGRDAGHHRALEHAPEPLGAPALPNPRQAGVIGQRLMQRVADKPADREVHLRLAHQPAVMHDAEQESGQHQPNRHLWVDAGPTVIHAVDVAHLAGQPAQIENPIDAGQDMVVGNELA